MKKAIAAVADQRVYATYVGQKIFNKSEL
jgi:hypothetical protein